MDEDLGIDDELTADLRGVEYIVCEDWAIYPQEAESGALNWDKCRTARGIGAIELISRIALVPLKLQPAAIKSTAKAMGAEELFVTPLAREPPRERQRLPRRQVRVHGSRRSRGDRPMIAEPHTARPFCILTPEQVEELILELGVKNSVLKGDVPPTPTYLRDWKHANRDYFEGDHD